VTGAREAIAESLEAHDPTRHATVGVTVDLVVLTIRRGRLSVLLVERSGQPFAGWWALPGGFVEPDEALDDAAERQLAEKTGIRSADFDGHLEQLATFGDPGRDPRGRVVSVAYVAMVADPPPSAGGGRGTEARWWAVDGLADEVGSLAFDHDSILTDGVERVRAKLEYTTVAAAFVDSPFSLSDLRHVYETVWGVALRPQNFARKVLSADGFVVPLGEQGRPSGGRGRPAALYERGPATEIVPAMLRPAPAIDSEPVRGGTSGP
jgi:8-oxo-dGTP diphosphatase